MKKITLLIALLFILSACQSRPPAPELSPSTPTPSATPEVVYVVVTNTPTKTAILPSPTMTRTPRPPSLTPRPPTNTPTLFPTWTPTPSPVPALSFWGTPSQFSNEVITPNNLDQIQPLLELGSGLVKQVNYSPDGEFIYVRTDQGFYIYTQEDPTQPRKIIRNTDVLLASPSGQLETTARGVRSLETGEWILLFPSPEDRIVPIEFSPAEDTIAIERTVETQPYRYKQTLELWNLLEGNQIFTFENKGVIAFSRDGNIIAMGDEFSGTVTLFNLQTGKMNWVHFI